MRSLSKIFISAKRPVIVGIQHLVQLAGVYPLLGAFFTGEIGIVTFDTLQKCPGWCVTYKCTKLHHVALSAMRNAFA